MDLFSERLKELRKLNKMTQKEVGEKIGMTAQGYAAFERGREPSFEKLKQLADLFKVSSDYLIGMSDSWNPADQSILNDYGFTDLTLNALRNLKETKDCRESVSIGVPFYNEVNEIVNDDRTLADILNEIIENERFYELLTYLKYRSDLSELFVSDLDRNYSDKKLVSVFGGTDSIYLLTQLCDNSILDFIDHIGYEISRENPYIDGFPGRINSDNAKES